MPMRSWIMSVVAAWAAACACDARGEPLTSAVTFQGMLTSGGAPVNGTADARFRLYDAAAGGGQVGPTLELLAAGVSGGLLVVELDFGAGAFLGDNRWVEVDVRTPADGGLYTTLAPRQRLAATPYALFSPASGLATDAASLGGRAAATYADASNLTAGTLPSGRLSGTYGGAVAFTNPANTLAGGGASITGLSATNLSTGTLPSARLSGTYSGALTLSNAGNVLSGNGLGLVGLSATNLSTGTLPGARLAGTYASALTLSNAANVLAGDGAALTNLNAANLASGTLPGGRLAGTYAGAVSLTSASNVLAGNGAALTSLNASNLASGTLPGARLAGTYSSALTLSNAGNVYAGSGAGLSGLWTLAGNAGTVQGTHFVGTTDAAALELRTWNVAGLRLVRRAPNPDLGELHPPVNVIGGDAVNSVNSVVFGATIAGGGGSAVSDPTADANRVLGPFGTIGGGAGNTVGQIGSYSWGTIAGGLRNTAAGGSASIGGGSLNSATGLGATVAGGESNAANDDYAAVGGGNSNTASFAGAVAGGDTNTAGTWGAVGGGASNTAGLGCAVAGGIGNTASGYHAAVGGGGHSAFGGVSGNTAGGVCSTVPGGTGNSALGNFSFAAGTRAVVNAAHPGTFVWSDASSLSTDFASTASNQFIVRAVGGVGINRNNPQAGLDVTGGARFSDQVGIGPVSWPIGAELYVKGAAGLGRVLITPTTSDTVSQIMLGENASASNGVLLRENGATNALDIVDITTFAEDGVIASFDRDGQIFSAGNKAFRIDHPLDPLNKELWHSCVESPDMLNVYSGNAVTDAAGSAVIELPAYFEALNREFRYQLTVIDDGEGWVFAKVTSEIEGNRFTIRTSAPGVKVSWQVTGVRHDALAEKFPVRVERDKTGDRRGTYLHPAAFRPGPKRSDAP